MIDNDCGRKKQLVTTKQCADDIHFEHDDDIDQFNGNNDRPNIRLISAQDGPTLRT